MDGETSTHRLPDGRVLAFREFGDPDGDPIFHAHGVPSSRLEGALLDDAARRHGFRVISTDRPGIGRSTYLPDRRLLDYPRDISSLADALGLARFGVMGASGGGAHTAVCAYAIPERLTVNVTVCPFTSFAEFPAPETLLSGAEAVTWRMARISPALVFAMCGSMALAVRGLGKRYEKWAATAANNAEGPDGEVARANPEKMATMGRVTAEAFAQGGRGVAVDTMIQYSDWGFRLADLRGRIHLFHGTEDALVPFEFGRFIADRAPDCEFHPLEGWGHFITLKSPDLVFETARREVDSRGQAADDRRIDASTRGYDSLPRMPDVPSP